MWVVFFLTFNSVNEEKIYKLNKLLKLPFILFTTLDVIKFFKHLIFKV